MFPLKRRVLMIGAALVFILACNLPQATPPADVINASTAAALTVAAVINNQPQPSPLPSATQPGPAVDTFTPLPTLSPTLSYTSTSAFPIISVSVDTNCRLGTGLPYERVGGLLVGETAEVIARDPTGEYWYIRDPESPTGFCWVWGKYATVIGNTSILPIFTPPPSPTPAPSFTLTYAGFDLCVGWWADLRIKNTGPVAFKSYSLSIRDRTQDVTLHASGDGFTDLDGCLSSAITSDIDPGDSFILSSPAFVNNINNHNMRATLTVCTKIGQGGVCVSQTIDFKP